MITLTHFPQVLAEDHTIYYGGSQDWFRNKWRAMSGCASVSAVNLAAFDAIGILPDMVLDAKPVYSLKNYLRMMNRMFRSYMTSGMMGFPDPLKYEERYRAFGADHGVKLSSCTCSGWEEEKEAVFFVTERIAKNRPVAILILSHDHTEIEDITWHWMTITGVNEASGQIVVSNYGKREQYDCATVFAVSPENRVHMISFDIGRED